MNRKKLIVIIILVVMIISFFIPVRNREYIKYPSSKSGMVVVMGGPVYIEYFNIYNFKIFEKKKY